MRKDDPGHIVGGYFRPQEWIIPRLPLPGVPFAGDAMMRIYKDGRTLDWEDPCEVGAYHPSTSGTHGKSLRLAHENNISWLHMIAYLSKIYAKHLGDAGLESMKKQGRLPRKSTRDLLKEIPHGCGGKPATDFHLNVPK